MPIGRVKTDFGSAAKNDIARDMVVLPDGKIIVVGAADDQVALLRYNADGALDTTFHGDGKVNAISSALFGTASAVSLQGDGKIVVSIDTGGSDFKLARFNADGTLDITFGSGGVVSTDMGGSDSARDVFVQADSKIVIVGTNGADTVVARYNADGTLDSSLGGTGKLTVDTGGTDSGASVIVQADGKIVVAGPNYIGGSANFVVVRYNTNGTLDASFSFGGIASATFGAEDIGTSIALQADGKFVVAGYTNNTPDTTNDFAVLRFNADGTPDTTFDGDGKVTTSFGNDDRANSVVIQNDGKILVAGSWDGGASDFAIVRYNTNGSLDTSFSGDGKANLTFGSSSFGNAEFAYSIKLQADGKILIVGNTNSDTTAGDTDIALARLNADGSLDTTFNGTGKVKTDVALTATNDIARDFAIQADGKSVVVGESNGAVAIARYNVDGTLDTTFSGDGRVTSPNLGPFATSAYGVSIQNDGKIVVAGNAVETGDMLLQRYTTSGALDATFGAGGTVTVNFGGADVARDVVVQADGKIVVVGNSGADFAIARYNADGTADLSFGAAGKLITDINFDDAGAGVIVQQDGKIVVAGSNFVSAFANFALVRYTASGALDTSFSSDGKFDFTFGAEDIATSIASQADGKFVIVGYTNFNNATTGPNDFAVARVNADGTLDTTFSGDGQLTTDFGNDDRANSVAIQSDGKILVAGSWDGGASDFAIVRYNTDGSLDTTFSDDGKANLTFGSSTYGNAEFAYSIKVQADGKILIVGNTNSDTTIGENDFAIARLNADGSIDSTFVGNGENWVGTANGDTHTGSGAGDTINGMGGSDSLFGDFGNDTLIGGAGADGVFGGDGTDTASYQGSMAAVTVNLVNGTGTGGDAQGDVLNSIENLIGSAFADTLIGNSIANVLNGGGDRDTASYSGSALGVAVNLATRVGSAGDANGDTYVSIENVTGSANGDALIGDAIANVLSGLAGNDVLVGGLGQDTLNGGDDLDTVDYSAYVNGVSINLGTGAGADGDLLIAIENALGSAFGDVLIGDNGANTMRGGAGNDFLVAGNGADFLDGQGDLDTVSYATATGGVFVNLGTGVGANGGVLANIENILGSAFGDVLYGDNGANTINGGAGNDFIFAGNGADNLIGGADLDTVSYETATTGVFANLGTGIGANGGVLSEIENLTGSNFGDVLYGSAIGNTIKGGAGNDFIVGGAGSDALYGGADADTFRYEAAGYGGDVIVDFQDGADKLSFATTLATSFSNFTVAGNGTTSVTLTLAGQAIVVQGAAAITLDAGDFLFV